MTKIKNILTIVLIIGLITMPQVNAFSLFGFDFGKMWNNFWEDEETQNKTKIKIHDENFIISMQNISITNKQAIQAINSNSQILNILKEIDYDCLYVNTNNNLNVSVFFLNNSVIMISKGKYCEDEIYFEESLINDLKQGFDKSKIMDYLDKVDMPMGMYYNLIKSFS